jgi:hypothetical protein
MTVVWSWMPLLRLVCWGPNGIFSTLFYWEVVTAEPEILLFYRWAYERGFNPEQYEFGRVVSSVWGGKWASWVCPPARSIASGSMTDVESGLDKFDKSIYNNFAVYQQWE